MNCYKSILLTLLLVLIFSGNDYAQDKTKNTAKPDTKMDECSETSCCSAPDKSVSDAKAFNEVCPVLGNKVNGNVKPLEYQGKLYGFCCPGCDDKFEKEPGKYIGNLSDDGKKFTKGKS